MDAHLQFRRLASGAAFAIVLALSTLSSTGTASAVSLVGVTSSSLSGANPNTTFGYNFTTGSSPLNFNHLGFWDLNADGLSLAHAVGLWDSSGNLLLSATVPSGTAALLDDGFRYVAVGSQTLAANTLYVLGAYTGSGADPMLDTATVSMNFGATFGTARGSFPASGGLDFPTFGLNPTFAEGWFGPNLALDPVPEPGTALLLASGLLVLCRIGRRTQH